MVVMLRGDLAGMSIPDVEADRWYTQEDLDGCAVESVCDDTGNVTVLLKDGSKAVLYSIDLDYALIAGERN